VPGEVVDILRDLIAVPSVNPRLSAPGDLRAGEQRLTDWLLAFFQQAGWRAATQPVHAARSNVIACIEGGRGDALLWEAHQDTVSIEGMSIDPFTASVKNGRVYGRGACDVKGPLAAMLAALSRAATEPPQRRPTILLACSVNEECGFTGARALADIWRGNQDAATQAPVSIEPFGARGLSPTELQSLRPSAAIVAEPTDLNVVIAHRGVVRWQCTVHGRAAHSSRPEEGANAIYAMTRVVRAIEEYHRLELASRPIDPLCGPPTACVTTIHGGTGPNTVPDRVVIDVDRRLPPDEAPQAAYDELVAHLAAHADVGDCRLVHDPPWMQSHGLPSGGNRLGAEQLAELARTLGVDARLIGVPYGTNAASIAVAGIPAVVFGPGSIAQAHTADEWIAVDQLERAVEVLYRVACGGIEASGLRPEA
jgi:acetylornithine deacetylase/succinyl-diaminopimelate desuccinylase-like protein